MPCRQVRDHADGNHKAQLIGDNRKTGEANGRQIELDGAVFLNLTRGTATSSQQVCLSPLTPFTTTKTRQLLRHKPTRIAMQQTSIQ